MKVLRILAIDDHEMILLGYKSILEQVSYNNLDIIVDTANSFKSGKEKIEESVHSFKYDIIFLDIQLFPPNDDQPHNGEDLGVLARELVPESKIIFMSSFSDNHRINSIIKSVNPDGYMVKTDIDSKSLEDAVIRVIEGSPYYSSKALAAIRKRMSATLELDTNDKKILYQLSIGTKTKDLEHYVELSPSSIENRKRQLKSLFGTEKENDLALVLAAKNSGFV